MKQIEAIIARSESVFHRQDCESGITTTPSHGRLFSGRRIPAVKEKTAFSGNDSYFKAQSIQHNAHNTNFDTKAAHIARHITKVLLLLGFSPRHFGFAYIREMILRSHETGIKNLSRIYAAIAQSHGQPSEAVQTAVRTALTSAQQQPSFASLEALYGVRILEQNYTLAPKEFLGIMLEYLTYIWDGKSDIP